MLYSSAIRHLLVRLLRRRLVLLGLLIGAACLFSTGAASALPPSPGKVPNGNVYYCGTCHESGRTFSDGSAPVPGSPAHGNFMQAPFKSTTPEKTWTAVLAAQDSDGDGFTNGEELQDPAGVWSIGQPDPGDPSFVSNPSDNNSANDAQECSLAYRATPAPPLMLDIIGYSSPASGDTSFGASVRSPLPVDFVKYTVKNAGNTVVFSSIAASFPFRSAGWDTKATPDGSYTISAQVFEQRQRSGQSPRTSTHSETFVVKNSAPSFGPAGEVVGTPANPCNMAERLNGVAAISAGDVWAVGTRFVNGPGEQVLFKHWDGLRWSSAIGPNASSYFNALHAVAASGPSDAWAVGKYDDGSLTRTLIER